MIYMVDRIRHLNKDAKIRLCVFMALMIWCIYLGAGYSYEMEGRDSFSKHISESTVDIDEIDDVYVDGSDFTPVMRLLGTGANGLLAFLYIFMEIVIMLVIAVMSLIPTLVLRFVGLRKKYKVTEDEYKFTKYIYLIAIGISLLLSFILTKFVGIIPCILYTAGWSLVLLVYVLGSKNRYKLYMLAEQRGVPYEQFVGLEPAGQTKNPQYPCNEYSYHDKKDDTYPFTDNLKEFPPKQ